jgi:hypothetical protein
VKSHSAIFAIFFFCAICICASSVAAQSQANPRKAVATPACNEPANHTLDFWMGEWNVLDAEDKSKAGESSITKILQGCAIEVNWFGAGGEHVKELFYYYKPKQQWIQVWVGDSGATKQRQSLEHLPSGAVIFEGEVAQMDGGSHRDRSTVTPLAGGGVHQVIEISRDHGKSWQTVFDAEYRKKT